jgi:hypothetical protein
LEFFHNDGVVLVSGKLSEFSCVDQLAEAHHSDIREVTIALLNIQSMRHDEDFSMGANPTFDHLMAMTMV